MREFIIVVSILLLPLMVSVLMSESVEASDLAQTQTEQNLKGDQANDGQDQQENMTEMQDPLMTRSKKKGKKKGSLCISQKGCREGFTCVKSKCQKSVQLNYNNCPPPETPTPPVIVTKCKTSSGTMYGNVFECLKDIGDQPEDSILVSVTEGGLGDSDTDIVNFKYDTIVMDCPNKNPAFKGGTLEGSVRKNGGPMAIRMEKTDTKCIRVFIGACKLNDNEDEINCHQTLTVVPAEIITFPRTA